MNTLKDRLSEKVEIIKSDNTQSKTNIVHISSNTDPQMLSVVPEFAVTLNEAKERIIMLQNFVKEMMVPNVDYGIIPRCDKPTLFKSGAEKLSDIFGFAKQIEVVNRVEDWQNGMFHYEVKATLISKRTGLVEAEGVGCCNSKEKKYKDTDPFNITNTILKMAKKRAFIDAVLSATRTSGLFSQDVEDIIDDAPDSSNPNKIPMPITGIDATTQNGNNNNQTASTNLASQKQLSYIINLVDKKQIPLDVVKSIIVQRYNVAESKLLSYKQASDFIDYLKQYNP